MREVNTILCEVCERYHRESMQCWCTQWRIGDLKGIRQKQIIVNQGPQNLQVEIVSRIDTQRLNKERENYNKLYAQQQEREKIAQGLRSILVTLKGRRGGAANAKAKALVEKYQVIEGDLLFKTPPKIVMTTENQINREQAEIQKKAKAASPEPLNSNF